MAHTAHMRNTVSWPKLSTLRRIATTNALRGIRNILMTCRGKGGCVTTDERRMESSVEWRRDQGKMQFNVFFLFVWVFCVLYCVCTSCFIFHDTSSICQPMCWLHNDIGIEILSSFMQTKQKQKKTKNKKRTKRPPLRQLLGITFDLMQLYADWRCSPTKRRRVILERERRLREKGRNAW